jgi:hypothetical protein
VPAIIVQDSGLDREQRSAGNKHRMVADFGGAIDDAVENLRGHLRRGLMISDLRKVEDVGGVYQGA